MGRRERLVMKEEITYVAEDGMRFDDRFDCARWEFSRQPFAEMLAQVFKKTHVSAQMNWCGGDPENGYSGPCGCIGCANHAFYELGLRYEHWKVWVDGLRIPQPNDDIPDQHTDVDVVLVGVDEGKRTAVFKVLRQVTGLGVLETKNLMDTKGCPVICHSVDFHTGQRIAALIDEAGGETKLITSGKQRRTVLF